jgi:hypothetical protein
MHIHKQKLIVQAFDLRQQPALTNATDPRINYVTGDSQRYQGQLLPDKKLRQEHQLAMIPD